MRNFISSKLALPVTTTASPITTTTCTGSCQFGFTFSTATCTCACGMGFSGPTCGTPDCTVLSDAATCSTNACTTPIDFQTCPYRCGLCVATTAQTTIATTTIACSNTCLNGGTLNPDCTCGCFAPYSGLSKECFCFEFLNKFLSKIKKINKIRRRLFYRYCKVVDNLKKLCNLFNS